MECPRAPGLGLSLAQGKGAVSSSGTGQAEPWRGLQVSFLKLPTKTWGKGIFLNTKVRNIGAEDAPWGRLGASHGTKPSQLQQDPQGLLE